MKKVICVVSAAFLTAYAPQGADGQQESRLQHVTEVHVKPGQVPLFEAAHAGRNERMAAAGVSFVARGTVSEALVYRFVTPVGDYEGLARREAEMRGMPSRAPGAPNGNDAIDHVDTYLRWTRPDLGYAPDNPRLAGADRQAVQRVRVYVQQGKVDAVVETEDGRWAAFEIELAAAAVEEGAGSLRRFAQRVDAKKFASSRGHGEMPPVGNAAGPAHGVGYQPNRGRQVIILPRSCRSA